ncbi:hypothetical protein ACFB49_27010 [Sphingomonas sp. DBB INV C78]|uniref:hypothetical protein n=1 Tax=Sphingomonas sp. DBB INV C78 TaxID=3349434 RepID=UPI0036D35737
MARRHKLKVYRTPIGFHDAYVAAPSQKAALAAWGSDNNLFAQGLAEEVKDPDLMEEPLASPEKVIRRSRGSSQEQLAALGKAPAKSRPATRRGSAKSQRDRKRRETPIVQQQASTRKAPAKRRLPPKPSRTAVETAEAAHANMERRHAREQQALVQREAELAADKRALEERQATEITRAQRVVDKAQARYRQALSKWSQGK